MGLKINYDNFSADNLINYLGSETGVRSIIRITNQTIKFSHVVLGGVPPQIEMVAKALSEASTLLSISGFNRRVKLLQTHYINITRKKTVDSVLLGIFQVNSVVFGVIQIIHYGSMKSFYVLSSVFKEKYLIPVSRAAASLSIVSRNYNLAKNGYDLARNVYQLYISEEESIERAKAQKNTMLASAKVISSLTSTIVSIGWLTYLPHAQIVSASLSLFLSIFPEVQKLMASGIQVKE